MKSRKVRYLFVGAFNTVVGYLLGVALYYTLSPRFHILFIGCIANVLAITVSFTTYKYFVFQTKDHWLSEYLRSYLVYGGMALIGIVLLWFLVDRLHLSILFAQAIAIIVTVIFSYLGHSLFTFREQKIQHTRSNLF